MNAILLLLIACAFAEDDIYSPFQRTGIIQGRINKIYLKEKKLKQSLKGYEESERIYEQTLEDLYKDMKYASSASDRQKMERSIEDIQKKLQEVRAKKVSLLRKMRRTSDKITAPFRDNIIRETRTESRVGLENEQTYVEEKLRTNNQVLAVSTKLAKKYAAIAAEIAAFKAASKKKNAATIAKVSQKAYEKTYKLIINTISKRLASGVARKQVSDAAQEAIEPIAEKLLRDQSLIPNVKEADAIVKKIVAKFQKAAPAKKGAKKAAKKAAKATKKAAKAQKKAAKAQKKAAKKAAKATKKAAKKAAKAQKKAAKKVAPKKTVKKAAPKKK